MEHIITAGLFENRLFDTILSLTLVYVLLSLLVSLITEVFNSWAKSRSLLLRESIHRMLEDDKNVNFGDLIYHHPLIDRLRKDADNLPSYISDDFFAKALIDVVCFNSEKLNFIESSSGVEIKTNPDLINDPLQKFTKTIHNLNESSTKHLLLHMLSRSKTIDDLQQELKTWYNDFQDRTSGWYKHRTKGRVRMASLIVVLFLNVDSIQIFNSIYNNDKLRSNLTQIANQLDHNYAQGDTSSGSFDRILEAALLIERSDTITKNKITVESLKSTMDSIYQIKDTLIIKQIENISKVESLLYDTGLPIGYKRELPPISWVSKTEMKNSGIDLLIYGNDFKNNFTFCSFNTIFYFIGLFITWLSLTFGAPFWFDVMIKFINIRSTGKKPDSNNK